MDISACPLVASDLRSASEHARLWTKGCDPDGHNCKQRPGGLVAGILGQLLMLCLWPCANRIIWRAWWGLHTPQPTSLSLRLQLPCLVCLAQAAQPCRNLEIIRDQEEKNGSDSSCRSILTEYLIHVFSLTQCAWGRARDRRRGVRHFVTNK